MQTGSVSLLDTVSRAARPRSRAQHDLSPRRAVTMIPKDGAPIRLVRR